MLATVLPTILASDFPPMTAPHPSATYLLATTQGLYLQKGGMMLFQKHLHMHAIRVKKCHI